MPRPGPVVHPVLVRVTHWINAAAMLVMIGSGLAIHNAHPILPFAVPPGLTIGGWLGGATRWHFAAMWLLVANGILAVVHGLASGRFRRRLLPLTPRAVLRDLRAALRGRLGHADPFQYNAVQKLLYLGVFVVGGVAILSGLAIWKPVQCGWLTAALGDFDTARLVHFGAMVAIVLFVVVHAGMALLVPASLRPMITGRRRCGPGDGRFVA